jgi:hypothetical protein
LETEYRYNVRDASGTLHCRGNSLSDLCPACRTKAEHCSCDLCRQERRERLQAQLEALTRDDMLALLRGLLAKPPAHSARAKPAPRPYTLRAGAAKYRDDNVIQMSARGAEQAEE